LASSYKRQCSSIHTQNKAHVSLSLSLSQFGSSVAHATAHPFLFSSNNNNLFYLFIYFFRKSKRKSQMELLLAN
jgi:hypothetical protein